MPSIPTLFNIGGTGKGLLGFGGTDKFNRQNVGDRGPINSGRFNLPHFGSQYNQYSQIADEQRTAPQAANSALQSNQLALIRQLEAQAAGQGPGQQLVAQHAQDQAQQTLRAQLAAQASGRGGAGAAFNAANLGAQAMAGVGNQRVLGGLQAQLNAFGQLGQNIAAGRDADETTGRFNADINLRSRGMDDARQMEALRQRLQASSYQQQGRMGYEQLRSGVNMANPTGWERLLSGIQGAGGMLLGGAGGGGGGTPTGVPNQTWGAPGSGGAGYPPGWTPPPRF